MTVEPLTLNQADEQQGNFIPPAVIEAVNALILSKWNGQSITLYQDEVIDAIHRKINVMRHEIFDKGWLDFEPLYRKAGWKVGFDKPGYNENYKAHFTFTRPNS